MLSPSITVAPPPEEAQIKAARESGRKRTAVAGAETEVALIGARNAEKAGLIQRVLIGNESEIRRAAQNIAWDLGETEVVGTDDERQTSARAVAMARAGEVRADSELAIAESAQLPAQALLRNLDAEVLAHPMLQIHRTPMHDTVRSRKRFGLGRLDRGLALRLVQLGLAAGPLGTDQSLGGPRLR